MLKEIIKIGDKSYIKAKVVMLPTDEKAQIMMWTEKGQTNSLFLNKPINIHSSNVTYQHLYITSDEEIKEDDWCINLAHKLVVKPTDTEWANSNSNNLKKIIASTDKLSTEPYQGHFEGIDCTNYLPQPSQSFIQKYIEEYNKGNKVEYVCKNCNEKYSYQPIYCNDCGSRFSTETFIINKSNIITDIMVEYVDNGEEGWSGSNEDGEPVWNEKFELKVNPKDNTITITKIKDSWNRDEVISFAEQYARMVQEKEIQLNGYKVIHNQKWISENL